MCSFRFFLIPDTAVVTGKIKCSLKISNNFTSSDTICAQEKTWHPLAYDLVPCPVCRRIRDFHSPTALIGVTYLVVNCGITLFTILRFPPLIDIDKISG